MSTNAYYTQLGDNGLEDNEFQGFALQYKEDEDIQQNSNRRKKKRIRIDSDDDNNEANKDSEYDNDKDDERNIIINKKRTNCNLDGNKAHNQNLIFANVANVFDKEKKFSRLCLITALYFTFVIFELICGYLANSIALMSDAAHSFSDCLCFGIYIVSILVTQRGTTTAMSFGFHRGEIIGMVVSVTIIWGLSFWLIYGASYRCLYPVHVDGLLMLLVSLIGLIFNLAMGILLIYSGVSHNVSFDFTSNKNDDHNNHLEHFHPSHELSCDSIRGTIKHILGDLLQNGTIVLTGAFIYFFPQWSIADPICTIAFTLIVLFTAMKILKDCILILMEGAPIDFDLEELGNDLLEIKGVIEVHDLHVWSLSIGKISLSCHLTTSSPQISLKKAREMIKKKYNITHTTIQVELDTEKMNNTCAHDLHY